MSLILHIVLFLIYSVAAVGAGAVAPFVLGVSEEPSGFALGVLSGVVVFLLGAVIHEGIARREDRLSNTRRLLLLKRAYDRSLGDLDTTRDEIRRIFEVIEAEGGDGLMERLRGAEARLSTLPEQKEAPLPRRRVERDPGADRAAVDPVPGFLSSDPGRRAQFDRDADLPFPGVAEEPEAEPPADVPVAGSKTKGNPSREMREVASEMRVLHSLVEQLYADRPARSAGQDQRAALAAALEGPRGAAHRDQMARDQMGSGTGGRTELRVVADRSAPPPPLRPRNDMDKERVLDIVREGLRRDRVDLYLQPIVSLPQRKRRFYECYSRIRAEDETVLGPDKYIEISREAGLLTAVDNMLLFRCVQLLRKLQGRDINAVFFCNIAPNSLADREFFKDFIEYMEQHAELAPNLVLEVAQADLAAGQGQLVDDFRRLGRLGYRFSLDRVKDLALDLPALEAMHVRFIKIDASLILERLSAGGAKATEIRMLKQELDEVEIDLVVERIETESQLVELLDFNIDYGQGYLFGEPRPSKDPGTAKAGNARA